MRTERENQLLRTKLPLLVFYHQITVLSKSLEQCKIVFCYTMHLLSQTATIPPFVKETLTVFAVIF